jgi:hydrogenase expression/formation protein HypE
MHGFGGGIMCGMFPVWEGELGVRITKAHGNGGRQTQQLIEEVFLRQFGENTPGEKGDAAILALPSTDVGFTTDGFVVKPCFFKGGDIGKLSVCGTVNDLAVSGCRPLYITAAFMIEEGMC